MKNKRLWAICLTLILCCVIHSGIHAMEIEMFAGLGNLFFDDTVKEPLGDGVFEPASNFLGSFGVTGNTHEDIINYRVSLKYDPLLRSRMIWATGFSFKYAKIEMGPFVGLFNQQDQPFSAGGMGSIQLMYPGIAYISASGASTFATPGEYAQNEGDISLGFWVPNVVCIFSMYTGSYSYLENDDFLITDQKLRYQFSADVYSKNVPYTIKIDMGYEELSRNYRLWKNDDDGSTDTVKSFYAGFTGTWQINEPLQLVLGLEMPLYLWTVEPARKNSKSVFYKAQAGIIWTIQEREKPAPKPEEN